MSSVGVFVIDGAILIALPYLSWRYLGLRHIAPLAMIQIIGGLALGPTVLGHIAPDFQHFLFPAANLSRLNGVATLAVVLFAFLTGMHLDGKMGRSLKRGTLGVALSSFLVPLILGVSLGYWLAQGDSSFLGPKASHWEFAFGFGICIAVTALPVLASLLREMNIMHTELGQQALGYAAVNDAALWAGVSVLLIAVAGAQDGGWHLAWIPLYLVFALLVLPWLMRRIVGNRIVEEAGEESDMMLITACGLALVSSVAAEYAGLGYVLGAFLGGLAMPASVRAPLIRRLDWPVTLLLMPFFFMVTGLRAQLDLFSPSMAMIVVTATVVAMAGKIGGVAISARLAGSQWRRALALGSLLQSKGLMEVLVVTILIDAGIVNSLVFSALIFVAIVCTVAAMPLTRFFIGGARTRAVVLGDRSLLASTGR